MSEEIMTYDVVIAGAGPAGLSAAIRLKQLAQEQNTSLSVCVLEKAPQVGAHTLSGAVIDTRSLEELLPNWRDLGAPITTSVTSDSFRFLTASKSIPLPVPPPMKNHGNYIVSLSEVVAWLGRQAEALGVEIYPGFPAQSLVFNEGRVIGVKTGDLGRLEDGTPGPQFQPGLTIHGSWVILGEGCRGHLTQDLIREFKLEGTCPQTYGLGIKEIWEIPEHLHRKGHVSHTLGWPLDSETYGGSFLYHLDDNKIAIGLVVGLDYKNPTLSPFEEFQKLKTHPSLKPLFEQGKRLSYGARALNEGGYQSLPTLEVPGAILIGCGAGFMNVPQIKGTHLAMKSGILGAEAVFQALTTQSASTSYEANLKESWIHKELYAVRNIRPGFQKGLLFGVLNSALETYVLKGRGPWTLSHTRDHESLDPNLPPKAYPKPDGKVTFDRLSSLALTGVHHRDHQPCHLILKNPEQAITLNWTRYQSPEQYYCPAGVYEVLDDGSGPRLQINSQNCIHCKTCDIKDLGQNIRWIPPEGGGGPKYSGM